MGMAQSYDDFTGEDFYRATGSLIGDGKCGGKAKGLAYASIALKGSALEDRVSFPGVSIVLSTEVFLDFINSNAVSDLYDEEDWELVKKRISQADFPDSLNRELERILGSFDEIGSPPIVVRSSSFLEDSIKLAFAGKYGTRFSPNCGDRASRLETLKDCVRVVFASLFNPSARAYREKHGIEHREDAMAVIIQSMSGRQHGNYFYPEIAGTLFSRVFRRPNPRILKEDGLMRIAFGMGTRTVDRCAARIFYLTNPSLRPEGSLPSQLLESSQEYFDYIDSANCSLVTGYLTDMQTFLQKEHKNYGTYVQNYADNFLYSTLADPEGYVRPLFTFHEMHLKERALFDLSKELLKFMEETTGFPVDIEFTYEVAPERLFRMVQMRPLAAYVEMGRVALPDARDEDVIFRSDRMVSNGVLEHVKHIVYVDPAIYKKEWNPSGAARAIGEANKKLAGTKYILAGPGRWGSRNPALGVPILYAEICNCGCLVEISVPELNFSPELSFGTHFFLDMDTDGILYLPVFSTQKNNVFNAGWLDSAPYTTGEHPAVRIYDGDFSIYLDGEDEAGIIVKSGAV
ncbi:pyruvate, phosphate dikinase [Synergistales bacterium]|nr:pyruvate, phosphate dikinase [Synergistales bacterium]